MILRNAPRLVEDIKLCDMRIQTSMVTNLCILSVPCVSIVFLPEYKALRGYALVAQWKSASLTKRMPGVQFSPGVRHTSSKKERFESAYARWCIGAYLTGCFWGWKV